MNEFFVFGIVLGLTAAITGFIRTYAMKKGMLDTPNARSSHDSPTPRGGGLSIMIVFVGLLIYLQWQSVLSTDVFLAIAIGSGLTGVIGFADDHQDVPAVYRIIVHILAATVAVLLIDPEIEIDFGSASISMGVIGKIFAIVFIVWLVNLFNFMDGIDGIAGLEGAFVLLAAAVIGVAAGLDVEMIHRQFYLIELGLASACVGFLFWNWPPAKIFMGDVGSGFLGFAIGAIAIASVAYQVLPLWTWLILLGVFFVDATATLTRRVIAGERWYHPHRSHAYQRASRKLGSHSKVTLIAAAINVCWLMPLAWYAATDPENGWWLTVIAWSPLLLAWSLLGGGRRDND